MPFVFGYTRISTDDTKQEYSLEGQALAIEQGYKARAALPGHVFNSPNLKLITPFFQDMASAWKKRFKDRPAGAELYRRAQRGDHIIVAMNDRAFRSPRDMYDTMEDFERRGISLHILNMNIDPTDPVGRMILGILTMVAEWESNVKSLRTKQAYRTKKYIRGIALREPPLGWKWIKRQSSRTSEPVPDLHERRLGNFCCELWTAGSSFTVILAECQRLGKGKSKARVEATYKEEGRPLSENYLNALVDAASWGFPLPPGAETGYIELPTLDELGRLGHVPDAARPDQG